jgi:hypothetical protein
MNIATSNLLRHLRLSSEWRHGRTTVRAVSSAYAPWMNPVIVVTDPALLTLHCTRVVDFVGSVDCGPLFEPHAKRFTGTHFARLFPSSPDSLGTTCVPSVLEQLGMLYCPVGGIFYHPYTLIEFDDLTLLPAAWVLARKTKGEERGFVTIDLGQRTFDV